MKQTVGTVVSNKEILGELERPEARTILRSCLIELKCPEIAADARPGQFIMVRCGDETVLPRPFSIHQTTGDEVALFFAALEGGRGSQWLSKRQLNDSVEVFGPMGNGFSIDTDSKNILLVAGGMGLAPLCFLAQQATKQKCSVTLLRGASGAFKSSGKPNPDQHYPEELLPHGIKIITITTSPDGMTNMVTDLLPEYADSADQIFACGPLPMYQDMANRKKELGLEGKNVQVSLEVRMACGRGLCYGCSVKTRQGQRKVCADGPVFNLDDIIWDGLKLL